MPHRVQRHPDQHHRRRALIRRGQRQAHEHPLPRQVPHGRAQQGQRMRLREGRGGRAAPAQHEVCMRRAQEVPQAGDKLVAATQEALRADSMPPIPATWR